MKAICDQCKNEYSTLPSWYKRSKRHFCSKSCSAVFHKESNAEHLRSVGAKYRFKPGHTPSKNRVMQKGESHYAWKGESVGYRGLHYWLRRVKGVPEVCIKCGSTRSVQWANTDGKYRRDPDDFVEMCASCHKKHDLAL